MHVYQQEFFIWDKVNKEVQSFKNTHTFHSLQFTNNLFHITAFNNDDDVCLIKS